MPNPRTIQRPVALLRGDGTTLHSIRSFWERHPGAWPSEGALRFLIHARRDELRKAGAVLVPPRVDKVLIDENKFVAWLRNENDQATIVEQESA